MCLIDKRGYETMAMRSKEFIGKAEKIKSHELSVKSLIESIKGTLSNLNGKKNFLERERSSLYAELVAAENDYDGPDYGLIASIERQIDQTNDEIEITEGDILKITGELEKAEREYKKVEEEKQQTLFEIQQRARTYSQDIAKIGGVYGAYAAIGQSISQSMQANYDALSKAATILDGPIDSIGSGRSSNGGGSAGGRNGPSLAGSNGAAAIAGASNIRPSNSSTYSMRSSQGSVGNSSNGSLRFSKGGNIGIKPPSYRSQQASINTRSMFTNSMNNTSRVLSMNTNDLKSNQEPCDTSIIGASHTKRFNNVVQDSEIKKSAKQKKQGVDGVVSSADVMPWIARHGRNEFIDSLIVQDWELGRYSTVSLSSMRKYAARADYSAYLSDPNKYAHISYEKKPVIYIDPATIFEVKGTDEPNFWSYKTTPYSNYIDMARQIPIVYSMVKSGYRLTDLAKRNDVIGACTRNYYLSDDITVIRVGNGYIFGGEGRHRVMAALIAGVNLPVRVTDEFIKEQPSFTKKKDFESNKYADFRKDFANKSVTISEQILRADKTSLINLVKNEQLAKRVDFGEMDTRVARELVETIWKAKIKYPFLNFPFIGSTQSLNTNLQRNLELNLTRLYIQNNPTVPINQILKMVKEETNAYIKEFEIGENDLAVSITVKPPKKIAKPDRGKETAGYVTEYVGDTFSSKLSGISINTDNAKNYSKLCHALLAEEQSGASPKGCYSVNYLVNHEIGHQLDNCLHLYKDPDIIEEYKKHIQLPDAEQVENLCTYASTDIHEFIAEAWAESQCSSSPRGVAKMIDKKVSISATALMKAKNGGNDYARERER